MLSEQLITQLNGQTFGITPKTVTNSSGQTETYQIVERATPNSLSIKTPDGIIQIFTIEDGHIMIPTTGSVHFKTYYKRVSQ